MNRNAVKFALGFAAVCLVGCGDRRVEVTGRVTYNGAPLNKSGGKIVFVGPKGTQVMAEIGADGTYRATGVPAGPNRVAIYYANPEIQKARPFPQKGKALPTPPHVPQPFLTPSRYASGDTSGFSVVAQKGVVFDADLTGPQIR